MKMAIPQGVCVQVGLVAPDQPHEDRIVYRRRRLNRILFGLWFAVFFIPAALSQCFWAFIPCGAVAGFGLVVLVSELFGKDILHLYAQKGDFLILPLALSSGLEDCCFYSKDSFGRTHDDWDEFPQPDVSGLKKRLQALKRRGGGVDQFQIGQSRFTHPTENCYTTPCSQESACRH